MIRSYFDKRDSLEAVSRDELVNRARAGAVTILDVRPEDEFALGHLPNALNIPLRELAARLGEIDPKSEVVAYCRGPYCVLSYEAVAQLRLRGFNARRLEDGLPEWRAAGLPHSDRCRVIGAATNRRSQTLGHEDDVEWNGRLVWLGLVVAVTSYHPACALSPHCRGGPIACEVFGRLDGQRGVARTPADCS